MPITLGSNISSLVAQRRLNGNSSALSNIYERLASGLRLNHASDDPAGLSIASSLNSNARIYGQGLRNVNDAIGMLNIADGAFDELTNITGRLKELAEQSANGTYSQPQRNAMQTEFDALATEYNRIIAVTKFNGVTLLDGSANGTLILAGTGLSESITLNIGSAANLALSGA